MALPLRSGMVPPFVAAFAVVEERERAARRAAAGEGRAFRERDGAAVCGGFDVDEEAERAALLHAEQEVYVNRLTRSDGRGQCDGDARVETAALSLRGRSFNERAEDVEAAEARRDGEVVAAQYAQVGGGAAGRVQGRDVHDAKAQARDCLAGRVLEAPADVERAERAVRRRVAAV